MYFVISIVSLTTFLTNYLSKANEEPSPGQITLAKLKSEITVRNILPNLSENGQIKVFPVIINFSRATVTPTLKS